MELTDTYASFHNQEVRVQPVDDPKTGKFYNISSRYLIFTNKQACDDGLKPLSASAIRTKTNAAGIQDVFSTLYAELKKKFPKADEV